MWKMSHWYSLWIGMKKRVTGILCVKEWKNVSLISSVCSYKKTSHWYLLCNPLCVGKKNTGIPWPAFHSMPCSKGDKSSKAVCLIHKIEQGQLWPLFLLGSWCSHLVAHLSLCLTTNEIRNRHDTTMSAEHKVETLHDGTHRCMTGWNQL